LQKRGEEARVGAPFKKKRHDSEDIKKALNYGGENWQKKLTRGYKRALQSRARAWSVREYERGRKEGSEPTNERRSHSESAETLFIPSKPLRLDSNKN